ncbi:hypothetical protein GCM10009651_01810 [Microbacterium natoriense]|uniref:hypothetical protein n=1 Tax=Microbacterium natoriense TaxID=284570 RepID=UPI0031D6282E
MSTSDQQEQGPLTRKQLREIRLTGSTPVITEEEAAAAAAGPTIPPAPPLPRAAEPVEVAPAPVADADVDPGSAPLTRRQAREQERIKTASVPVIGGDVEDDSAADAADDVVEVEAVEADAVEAEAVDEAPAEEIVSAVPTFAPPVPGSSDDDLDDDLGDQVDVAPVSAAAAVETAGDLPMHADAESAAEPVEIDLGHVDDDPVVAVAALGIEVEEPEDEHDEDDVLADAAAGDDDVISEDERPTVSPEFGSGLLADDAEAQKLTVPSFDELLTSNDSSGSQHSASNTLIFNPPSGEATLDGPVASTGEILVTGSYELPQGIGSQGHAHGIADGKEVDAVLIDGELPPASSPTPIAASSAISTIKPAGEVIRPPAPEKGNKLMLTLIIVAGGLALAVGVVVVIALTTKLI